MRFLPFVARRTPADGVSGISRVRREAFGGIIGTEHPPALAFVDHDMMRSLGHGDASTGNERKVGALSAPIEGHFAITRYCRVGCKGCYMSAAASDEVRNDTPRDYENALAIADRLIAMQLFHVALGGGESLEIPWLFDLAAHFRRHGVVPNLTTSGRGMTAELARKCAVFGQVNVSLDGLHDAQPLRPSGQGAEALEALRCLRREGLRVGINCVVTRQNFDALGEVFALARSLGLTDVELLRIKPSGRGRRDYVDLRLAPEQAIQLISKLQWLALYHRVRLKLDCSFTPLLCAGRPPKKVLERFAILGCDAGNWLIGVDPEGRMTPCSFLAEPSIPIADAAPVWSNLPSFEPLRRWHEHAPEPCRSCHYVELCKGGCRAVSYFLSGSMLDPDPECPTVASASCR